MQKNILSKTISIFFILTSYFSFGQFTDIINSNYPGESQGAYSVGRGVIQAETNLFFESSEHKKLLFKQNNIGLNYNIRYGFWREQLEVSLNGILMHSSRTHQIVDSYNENKFGFVKNTIGAKYMIYEPKRTRKMNLHSWKANAKFNYKKLLPSIGVYVGANVFQKRRYLQDLYADDFGIVSPKVVISLQSHPQEGMVLTSNFIADNLIGGNRTLSYIISLTHTLFYSKWSIFLENEGIKSTYYNDSIFRIGTSFLADDNLHFDASLGTNLKDSPSRLIVALGASYRIIKKHKNIELKEKLKARERESMEDGKIFNFNRTDEASNEGQQF